MQEPALNEALEKKLKKLGDLTKEVKTVLIETEKKLRLNEKFLNNRIKAEFKRIIDAEKEAKINEINAKTSLSPKEKKLQIQMNDVIMSVAEDEADTRQGEILQTLSSQVRKEVVKVRGLAGILVTENEKLVEGVSSNLKRLTLTKKKEELATVKAAIMNLKIVKQSLLFSMFTLATSVASSPVADDVILRIRSIYFSTLVKPITCWIFLPVPTEFCAEKVRFDKIDLSWKGLVNLADFTKPFYYRLEVMLSSPLPPLVEVSDPSYVPSLFTSPAFTFASSSPSVEVQALTSPSAGCSAAAAPIVDTTMLSRRSLDLSRDSVLEPSSSITNASAAAARRMSTGASAPRGFRALFGSKADSNSGKNDSEGDDSQIPKRSASAAVSNSQDEKENDGENGRKSTSNIGIEEEEDDDNEDSDKGCGGGEKGLRCHTNARYYLQLKTGSFTQVYEGLENMFSVARLFPGSNYSFRVCAGYSNTFGGWSKILNLETKPVPCPTEIAAERVALTSLTLAWVYPYCKNSSIRFVIAHKVCEDAPPPQPPSPQPSEGDENGGDPTKESEKGDVEKEEEDEEERKKKLYASFYDDTEDKALEKERKEKEIEENLRLYGEDIDAEKEGYELIDAPYSAAVTETEVVKPETSRKSSKATTPTLSTANAPKKMVWKFRDLEGFKVHEFRIRAVLLVHGWDSSSGDNESGDGNAGSGYCVREYASFWSQPLRVRTNVVEATCSARVISTGRTSAVVKWTPIDVDGGSYQVEVSKKRMLKTVNPVIAYEGPATRHVLEGLEPDTKYEMRVRAGSDDRWGQWSSPVSFQTLRHAAPAKVTVRTSCISAYLSWPPACDGRATTHHVDVRKVNDDDSGKNGGDNDDDPNRGFERKYEGPRAAVDFEECFEPGATYEFRVRGGCEGEWGEWSRVVRVKMDPIEVPSYFDASDVRCISATINWSPITIDPRVASVYQIQVCHLGRIALNDRGEEDTTKKDGNNSSNVGEYETAYDGKDTCCVWGVLPQNKYQFRVRAGYGGRWGPWSVPLSVTSTAITVPTNFKLDTVAALSLACSWRFVIFDPRKTTLYQVEIRRSNDGSDKNDFARVYEGKDTEAVVPLRPETAYELRLRAGCEQYWSDWLTVNLAAPAIPVPHGLRVAHLTCISAALAWDAVVLDVRQQTHYVVEAAEKESGNSPSFAVVYDGLATEFVLPLVPETPYVVRLRAYCAGAPEGSADATTTSEWSAPVEFVAPEVPPPADECVVEVTCTSATLRWHFGDNGDAPPIKPITYLVGVSGGNAVTGVVRRSLEVVSSQTVIEYVVPMLPEGGYKLKIRPSCDAKWGKWGKLLKVLTPKVPVPTSLAISSASCASLSIVWDPVVLVGPHRVHYEVELCSDTGSSDAAAPAQYKKIYSGEEPCATAAGSLEPGTTYKVRVRAGFDDAYWSDWAEIVATTAQLPAVEGFDNSATCISARIAWAPAALDPVRQTVYQLRRDGDADAIAYEGAEAAFTGDAGDLAPDTEYVYWVRTGFGGDLWGPWSRTSVRTRGVTAPALEAPNRRSTCLYLRWSRVDIDPSVETRYRLEMKARKREDFRLLYEGPKEGMDLVGVLVPDRGYLFRVRAGYRCTDSAREIWGEWTEEVVRTLPIPAPTYFIADSVGCSFASLKWGAVDVFPKMPTQYSIEMSLDGGAAYTAVYEGPATTYLVEDPLVPATKYMFRIKAGARGYWSDWVELIVRTTTVPVPAGLKADHITLNAVHLVWEKVVIRPTVPTLYRIKIACCKFEKVVETQNLDVALRLDPAIPAYMFRIAAGCGDKLWSKWSDPTLDVFPPKWLSTGWRQCPNFVEARRRYTVNGLMVEKTSDPRNDSVILGADQLISGFEKHKWGVKIVAAEGLPSAPTPSSATAPSGSSLPPMYGIQDLLVGVAPVDIYQNMDESYMRSGWFIRARNFTLVSGPPHNYRDRAYGPSTTAVGKVGDVIGLEMNMKNGTLSFLVNETGMGVAYENIPLDAPLVPVVILTGRKDCVEIVL